MLKGKTAFITGTNRGIGKEILREFAKNGANVFAHARCESDDFLQMINNVASENNVTITPVYFDIVDSVAMKDTVRKIILSKEKVDILVNNAGIAHGGLFQMTSMAKIKEVFDINLFAQMELTQLLLRYMIKNGGGSIINMSSVLGLDLPRGSCAYGLSKATVAAFTQVLSSECGTNGIRVNAIAPGLVDTDMANLMDKKVESAMLESSTMKRRATTEEIAQVALFLASDKASYINGQVIRVDGGKI